MSEIVGRLGVALVFLLVLLPGSLAQAVSTSPNAILTNPDRFDGQAVTLTGTMTNLRERVSGAGNPYYTFDLSDGTRAIRVFSFGQAPCKSGQVTVDGTFQAVKRQGRYTFHNEVTATKVTCS